MVGRLRKGLFSDRPMKKGLFGLLHGQKRLPPDDGEPLRRENGEVQDRKVSYGGGWLNGRGEIIGQGDLNVEDARRIASELQKNEIFLVMPAYWLALHEDKPALPLSCVLEHGAWLIESGRIRRIRASHHPERSSEYFVAGQSFGVVSVSELKQLLSGTFEAETAPGEEVTSSSFRTVYAMDEREVLVA